jgi:hypothetical protein
LVLSTEEAAMTFNHIKGRRSYVWQALSLVALLLVGVQVAYFLNLFYHMVWKYFLVPQSGSFVFIARDSMLIYLSFSLVSLVLLAACGLRNSWSRLWKFAAWLGCLSFVAFVGLLGSGVIGVIRESVS